MGGFYYDKKGYPRWRDSDELVHRTIAKADDDEVVHHKDGNPHNFRRENLEPIEAVCGNIKTGQKNKGFKQKKTSDAQK
jgi:5-methylcytosine-specific restriction endonuclease McrA